MDRIFFDHFPVAGTVYYDLPLVFTNMQIGDRLILKPEPNNRYDEFAVAIYFGDHKIGFVPRDCNEHLSKFLQLGLNIFDARIQSLCTDALPAEQVHVAIHLLKQ